MKLKTLATMKLFTHKVLFFICLALSINLFIQFTDFVLLKIVFALLAGGFEIAKYFLLIEGKYDWRLGRYCTASGKFVLVFGLTLVSVVASLGFALGEIEKQSFDVAKGSYGKDRLEKTIGRLEREWDLQEKIIEASIKQKTEINLESKAVYWVGKTITDIDKTIEEAKSEQNKISKEIKSYELMLDEEVSKDTVKITASNIFTTLGKGLNLPGLAVMFWLLLILVILLEISLVATSDSVEDKITLKKEVIDLKKPVVPEVRKVSIPVSSPKKAPVEAKQPPIKFKLSDYVDKLIDNQRHLLPDELIAKKNNISLETCLDYKERLKRLSYKGLPLLQDIKGQVVSNFSRKELLKLIKNLEDKGIVDVVVKRGI
ncbi:MAG: hypothetical protein GF311_28455 [Candidatus Lokiarchaeota archaeon]|nr:hypothetical protein [Candidatus Lokiarchaeota archaeon]